MEYTLNQLQIFLKIVQNQSITKTAEELYMTQPAVSIQLKNFQNQFSIPLTEVVSRKLFVTDFGYQVANSVEKILNEVDALNYKTSAFKGELSGRLNICSVSTGQYVLPSFLSGFMERHKGVDLRIDVTNKVRVVESLERNEVDFALVSVLPKKLHIEQEILLPNRLFLIGKKSNKIKSNNSNKDLFESMQLIFREEGSATRDAMKEFIAKNKLPVHKRIQLATNEAVKQAVMAGIGYSIMPVIGLKYELSNEELQIIPINGLPITTSWRLIWLKSKKLSPTAQAYLEYIRQAKEKIIKEKFNWIVDYY
ncbi:LysR family transcriptional regulator PycR [Arachidicoccus ginsenosidivorans]|jgi:DNA-binding transcriptional LysR family regulator|uniref:LysR family transcriptional regulator n=1 Tax=Arachidicoccus ginsenosidivorans TaxID=496057 RepID=A0A5B8VIH1_9BACT|nr:LysR substrate-binding domain-containing protein [Arachidicoccus ginsenosidivorans]QEC71387.1 LysR family transcriptional regulator [Arachidicoccus ginsenosidivorans]